MGFGRFAILIGSGLIAGVAPRAAGAANAFDGREDLPFRLLLGSAPTPTPCDVRIAGGNHDPNCLFDPRTHHYTDVKNDAGKRKTLEDANAAVAPAGDLVGDSFGRPGYRRPGSPSK
jgi:hypothetical protein